MMSSDGTRISLIDAERISPVSPIPPIVALNRRTLSVCEQR